MSSHERAIAGLATLGSLPQCIERALRAGLRERVLSRDSRGLVRTPPRHPALERFDRLTSALPLPTANRVGARSAIIAAAERFERSRLARRLSALPSACVGGAPDEAFDLVVGAPEGNVFAVRFAASRDGLEALALVAAIAPRARFARGVVIYDVGTGIARYFALEEAGMGSATQRRAGWSSARFA